MTDTATHSEARTTDVAPRIATWSFVAALAIVVVAATYVLWRDRGWLSSSDLAFFEIELMRIPDEWPLVGAYSRYGWSHPGPLLYYLLWGPWRLFGGASVGLLFGMLLLHMSALVIAWFAARFRSPAAAVLVVGALMVVWAGTASEALMPWNPLAGLLFGGTILILAWNASMRGRLGALLLFPTGSLLVQAHVSTAPVVLVLCLAAVLLAVRALGQRDPIPWRWWLAGIAITVVVWIPPLIDQFVASGNLGRILAAVIAGGPGLGLRQAATALVDAYSIPPYWWNPAAADLPTDLAPPWLLIVPAAALAVAVVKRDPAQLRFLALGVAALAVAGLSISRFLDPFTYLGAWIPSIAMVVAALSLWILFVAAGAERILLLAAPALLVLPAAAVAVTLVTSPPPLDYNTVITRDATAAIITDGLTDPGVHLDVESLEVIPALVASLQRQAIPVSARTPTNWPAHLKSLIQSDPGTRTPIQVREVWDPDAPVPNGWRIIAAEDPFTDEEWQQIQELRRAAADPSLTDDERALTGWALGTLLDGRYAWQILAPAD